MNMISFSFVRLTALLFLACAVSVQAETTSDSGATEITSVPCTISTSGTYYLSHDLAVSTNAAYAINITASNVTLDFNGHTLSQTYGTDNGTLGVYIGSSNVTVCRGTLVGFLEAVCLYGDNCCFEDLFAVATTFYGINLSGSNNLVRRCRVNNTGGETVPGLAPYALGIVAQNGNNVEVIDCDVTTLTPGPGCYTVCVFLNSVQNALIVNNRLSSAIWGGQFLYSTGKYRDNICAPNLYNDYGSFYTTVTDAGNNR